MSAAKSLHIEDGMGYEPLSLSVGKQSTGYFGIAALLFQAALTTTYFWMGYDFTSQTVFDNANAYDFYVGGAVWMFVGFGYVMTFMKAYGLGAVGFTMFICCLGLQWALLLQGWMKTEQFELQLDVVSFIRANVSVATVLVSFGSLLGKTSPMQILMLVVLELPAQIACKVYIMNNLGVRDVGGTIAVHVFGALFGLAVSFVITPKTIKDDQYGSTYVSDLLSFLGTVFLWLFWPSFVAGDLPIGSAEQKMAFMNTVFALLGSTVVVFGLTTILHKKRLATMPIQMATLAGGVAIGAVANFPVIPGGAILIGMGAGIISCCMFMYAHNLISDRLDPCGIMSLHGGPGIYGGIVSIFMPFMINGTNIDAGMQALGLLCVICTAFISGCFAGLFIKGCGTPVVAYNDQAYWECADIKY